MASRWYRNLDPPTPEGQVEPANHLPGEGLLPAEELLSAEGLLPVLSSQLQSLLDPQAVENHERADP